MSVRNLIGLLTVTPTWSPVALSSTSATQIISNAASSSTIVIITSFWICNSAAAAVTATVNMYSAAALGGTAYPLLSGTSIPAASAINLIQLIGPVFLPENSSIGVTAGTASDLTVNAFYTVGA